MIIRRRAESFGWQVVSVSGEALDSGVRTFAARYGIGATASQRSASRSPSRRWRRTHPPAVHLRTAGFASPAARPACQLALQRQDSVDEEALSPPLTTASQDLSSDRVRSPGSRDGSFPEWCTRSLSERRDVGPSESLPLTGWIRTCQSCDHRSSGYALGLASQSRRASARHAQLVHYKEQHDPR